MGEAASESRFVATIGPILDRWMASCGLCDWKDSAPGQTVALALTVEHLRSDHVLILGVGAALADQEHIASPPLNESSAT